MTRARRTDPATSHAAGRSMDPHVTRLQQVVLNALGNYGPATADFVESNNGVSIGLWKRFSELEKLGLIEPTGETRPTRSGRQGRVYRLVTERPAQGKLFEVV